MISLETYVLTKAYTDKKILDVEEVAIDRAVEEAVDIAKKYTDQQLSVASWNIEICQSLPLSEIDTHTIYFVPMSGDESNNHYYEYIYIENNGWELIGSTEFKPNNYMTKQEIQDYVNEHQYTLIPATSSTLGGVIVDTNSIVLDSDGRISISAIEANSILNLFN